MRRKDRWLLTEAALECGLSEDVILRFVTLAWVNPADPELIEFDLEDLARVRLIAELQEELGVNDAAVPVILQLLDQLHYLRSQLRRS